MGGQLAVGAFDGWLASICAIAGELAVYAGLAAGAAPGGAPGLGPGHRGGGAARHAEGGPADPPGPPGPPRGPRAPGNPPEDRPAGPGRALAVLAARVPALPAGERAVVITVTAAVYGTRMSLLVLTWWGAVALAWAVAGPRLGKRSSATADDAPGDAPDRLPPGAIAAARDDGPIARFAGASSAGSWCRCPPRWPG